MEGEDELDAVGKGMYQFADEGARYTQGKIPAELGLFDPATSVAILDEIPAEAVRPTVMRW